MTGVDSNWVTVGLLRQHSTLLALAVSSDVASN